MIHIERTNVIAVSEHGGRFSIRVDFVDCKVEVESLDDAYPDIPPDIQRLSYEWQEFADNEGFEKIMVEHPEDAKKCVTPF